ncbi:beta-ketoacyl-ACP synthase II [Polluticaenibacter yanchengensis]|uniref:3-oxoacyl-[acyl-carrier-protein] synthase 2 n=1 Tax=Polluticaenibacter yanchengensis TaxID=3014562 RepID=A0ABT4UJ08_9BACT|nr:beta-ketoacyl-ACP synthase II [Chitinophagaceae bacterium LY-5]
MKRVVVTGLGVVSPLGNTIDTYWDNLVNGTSGAGLITRFNTDKFKTKLACELKSFEPEKHLDRNEIKRSDLFTQYALYAATEAVQDAGIDIAKENPFDIGVIWGVGQGGMETFESEVESFVKGDYNPRFSPFFIPKLIVNLAAGMISMKFGFQGINYCTVSACATANTALMDAFNYIRLGKAKVIVTGGSEAPITQASIGGFSALKAMSTRNDDPATASRPFDINRDGFVMGEGAGAIILEDYDHAVQRGAKIYAEMIGASMTADAYHMTSPHPEGIGASMAMKQTLEEGGINPAELNYLNLHATSTPVGDIAELNAVAKTFPDLSKLYLGATKSMTGHLLGAAGAIEAIASIKATMHNLIPPTINVEELDPKIPAEMNIVLKDALETEVKYAMSNAFGFGGHNSTVLFKKA